MVVNGQLHTPCHFIPEKWQWYPINKRVGGPQSESGFSGALAPAENRTPNPPQPSHSYTSAVMDL